MLPTPSSKAKRLAGADFFERVAPLDLLESRELRRDGVAPGRDQQEEVLTGIVGDRRANQPGVRRCAA